MFKYEYNNQSQKAKQSDASITFTHHEGFFTVNRGFGNGNCTIYKVLLVKYQLTLPSIKYPNIELSASPADCAMALANPNITAE